MRVARPWLVLLLAALASARAAHAAKPFLVDKMATFDRSYHYVDDRPVRVWKPDGGSKVRNQLVVFLHGCCAGADEDKATAAGDDFLATATAHGYHAISLDFFADQDHPAPGGFARSRCACDPDCYGHVLRQMFDGTTHEGLPEMDPRSRSSTGW